MLQSVKLTLHIHLPPPPHQMYNMSVNSERNVAGDLLVHVAVKGGLLLLPLLFVLIHHFRADVSLRNSEGLTPLCLAAKLGESKIAEVGTPPSHHHILTPSHPHCHMLTLSHSYTHCT